MRMKRTPTSARTDDIGAAVRRSEERWGSCVWTESARQETPLDFRERGRPPKSGRPALERDCYPDGGIHPMIVLEVLINGRFACRAGVRRARVLSAIVNWVGSSPRSPYKGGRTRSGEAWVHVGGLYVNKSHESVHPRWLNRVVRPGDEILVRVVESRRADRPRSKTVTTRASLRKQERAYYLRMKKKFERRRR
jgi:hypothetical protein